MDRAQQSMATFGAAARLASDNGMILTNPSAGCYQLRHRARGWILNLYPRSKGFSPRAHHDPHRPGPFLSLPGPWTLLDAVKAAIEAEKGHAGELPPCPWCHSSKHVQASGTTLKAMYCRRCGREFEAEDDDGTIGYGSPEKYAERAERRQQQSAK